MEVESDCSVSLPSFQPSVPLPKACTSSCTSTSSTPSSTSINTTAAAGPTFSIVTSTAPDNIFIATSSSISTDATTDISNNTSTNRYAVEIVGDTSTTNQTVNESVDSSLAESIGAYPVEIATSNQVNSNAYSSDFGKSENNSYSDAESESIGIDCDDILLCAKDELQTNDYNNEYCLANSNDYQSLNSAAATSYSDKYERDNSDVSKSESENNQHSNSVKDIISQIESGSDFTHVDKCSNKLEDMIEDGKKHDSLHYSEDDSYIQFVFNEYDKNGDGFWDETEFNAFLQSVYPKLDVGNVNEEKLKRFMSYLDGNKDGMIDFEEFRHAWFHCFKKILQPVTALVVVDVQHDFIDGSLALRHCPAGEEGAEVVPVINRLLDENSFDMVAYTMDWHPPHHISFVENVQRFPIHDSCARMKATLEDWKTYEEITYDLSPPRAQVLWPSHCVQGSAGAKLHKDLKIVPDAVNIYKGTKLDIDSYSAFFDNMKLSHTVMQDELKRRDVTDVYICGLAYDVCVAATSKDAVELGYRTVIIDDACRGVSQEVTQKCKEELCGIGALITHSNNIKQLASNEDRNFDLGIFAAQTMAAL